LVRFQARLTARPVGSGQYLPEETLASDADDPWMRRSILLSINRGAGRHLAITWLNAGIRRPPLSQGALALIEDLSELAANNDSERLSAGLGSKALLNISQPEIGLAALRGAAKVWARKKVPDELRASLVPVEKLQSLARDAQGTMNSRTTAVALLAFAPAAAEVILPFLAPDQEQPIRTAAIAALARQPGIEFWQPLLDTFASETPPVRRAIIDSLLANAERTKVLLDAIENGRIKVSEIDLAQAKRLTGHRDAAIKERAGQLFEAATPADRAAALADYQRVLQMSSDPQRGRVVFEKACAACHRIAGIGVNVAPDISDSRTKKPDQLLADIIQPNRAIDNNYVGYTVRLVDGTIATGILTAETATSITLRQQEGKDAVIPRAQIEELRSSGQSLMPEGLEKQIPPQEMADLISFIKNWRYLDGRTPLSANGP
jgi:putative heme-binding domain-containing protein